MPPIYVYANVVFDANYQQELIDDFQSLKTKIRGPLRTQFCGVFSDCSFTFTSFREGSVIVAFLLIIVIRDVSECDVVHTVRSQMSSLPATIGGINCTPGSVTGMIEF